MFRRGNKKKANNSIDNNKEELTKDIALYFLTERNIQGMMEYAENNKLPIQSIFTDVEDAKVAMLMEDRNTRLVIIESGLGRFISINTRKDLIDLIGICNGIDKKVSIFYTNSLLRADTLSEIGKKGREIQWYHYQSTNDVIKEISKLDENYIESKIDNSENTTDDALNFIGFKSDKICEPIKHLFNLDEQTKQNNSEELIPKFKVNL